MGRKRKGSKREIGPGRFEVRVAGDHVGVFTEEEADRKLAAVLAEHNGVAPATFGLFADPWFDRREIKARRRKRGKAFDKERSRWRAHVKPAPFWNLPFKRCTVQVAQAWVEALGETEAVQCITFGRGKNKRTEYRPTGRPRSRKVISEALNLAALAFDAAIRAGKAPGLIVAGKIAAGNPFRMVLLPTPEVPEVDGELIPFLSTEEIAALFALKLSPFERAVFAVAIYVGLRREEIWGLRWQDVVFDDGPDGEPEIQVRRAYDGPVKTRNALRDVPMLRPVIEALKAWRATRPAAIGGVLVFPNEEGRCFGDSYDAGWSDHRQKRPGSDEVSVTKGLRTLAGIRKRITFRDIRHTCGCHLAQGSWVGHVDERGRWIGRRFDLNEIKTWLGHSSIAVTERHYSKLTKNNLHTAVAEGVFVGYTRDAKNGDTRRSE